LLKNNIKTRKK